LLQAVPDGVRKLLPVVGKVSELLVMDVEVENRSSAETVELGHFGVYLLLTNLASDLQ